MKIPPGTVIGADGHRGAPGSVPRDADEFNNYASSGTITQVSPPPAGPDNEYWVDTNAEPPAVYEWTDDAWSPVASGGATLPTGVFVQPSAPATNAANNAWVKSDTGATYDWVGSAWVPTTTLPTGTFVQSAAPASNAANKVWIDTDTNASYEWVGSAWVPTTTLPTGYFVQSSAPASNAANKVWVDTDTDAVAVWVGSAWVPISPLPAGVFVQDASPASPADGNLWVDTSPSPDVAKQRVSGAWVLLSPPPPPPSAPLLVAVVGTALGRGSMPGTMTLDLSAAEAGDVILLGYANYIGTPAGFTAGPGPFNFGSTFYWRYKAVATGAETTVTTGTIVDDGLEAAAVAAIFRNVALDSTTIAAITHGESANNGGGAAPSNRPTNGLDVIVGLNANQQTNTVGEGFNSVTAGWTLQTGILNWGVATQVIAGGSPAAAAANIMSNIAYTGAIRVTFAAL